MTPDWKIIGLMSTPLLALFGWMAKHISNTSKHPCKDEIDRKFSKVVFADVCEERGKANDAAHLNLKEGIDRAIERSDERHEELKTDMKAGFARIETVIKENGYGKGK